MPRVYNRSTELKKSAMVVNVTSPEGLHTTVCLPPELVLEVQHSLDRQAIKDACKAAALAYKGKKQGRSAFCQQAVRAAARSSGRPPVRVDNRPPSPSIRKHDGLDLLLLRAGPMAAGC